MIVVIEDDELAGRLLLKMLDEFFKDIVTVWLKSTSDAIDFFKNNTLTKKTLFFLIITCQILMPGIFWMHSKQKA